MAGDSLDASSPGDLEQAQRIHLLCEEFEGRARNGDWPRIEDYLDRAAQGDREGVASRAAVSRGRAEAVRG